MCDNKKIKISKEKKKEKKENSTGGLSNLQIKIPSSKFLLLWNIIFLKMQTYCINCEKVAINSKGKLSKTNNSNCSICKYETFRVHYKYILSFNNES